jgi:hypothetical protein
MSRPAIARAACSIQCAPPPKQLAAVFLAGWSQPREEIRYELDFFQSISGDGFGNPCSFDFSTNAFVWRIREQDEWQGLWVL